MSEPGIGHNVGDPIAVETANLRERYDRLFARAEELKAAVQQVPAEIADEEQAGKVAELRRMLRVCFGELEAARKVAKAPWDRIAKAVHSLFVEPQEQLTDGIDKLDQRERTYLRRRRDEEEARRREALREAQEREAAAWREREAAEALARAADAEQAKARDAMAAVQLAAQARDQQEAAAKVLQAAEQQAAEPVKVASVGAYGARTSLRKVWSFRNLSMDKIDLDALRPYLGRTAVETALRLAIRQGMRECKGVEIFEDVATTNR